MMNQSRLSIKMAIRNIIVHPGRAFMSVIGVMGCVALLVCAFGIGDSVNYSIDNELNRQFTYDINTTYDKANETVLYDYLDNKGADYEPYRSFLATVSGYSEASIYVYVLESPSAHTTIDVSEGVAISRSKADTIGVKEGDEITISVASGSVVVTIDSLVDTSVTQGVFISEADFGLIDLDAILTYHLWISLYGATDEIVDEINSINGTNGAWLKSDRQAMIDDKVTSINTIRKTMMIFSILLSVVVLYNFSLLNMKESIRDIATLKVLGHKNIRIGKILVYQMMILVSIGTIFGLLLGYPMLYLVMSSNKVDVMAYLYHIEPASYVYAALLSIGTGFIFNIVFTTYIRKIKMVESLKSIE
ncbi:MAG TPA: hypothetical protein PLH02_05910 [Bacillota bacterium]|nr:hypothetical protein [Bacillota bacterium]HPF42835.1 hypothetical protein [Bacillota bacterium]HPJ86369.1 hypothetical protein [Bacillota bacterium]HPQ62378.1 hypothetical protein [Bacillota bacterium]HRX92024.1 hypothetical protein [Candidatus Izemoplasmatales bacterium]